jgi:hypothetical protein
MRALRATVASVLAFAASVANASEDRIAIALTVSADPERELDARRLSERAAEVMKLYVGVRAIDADVQALRSCGTDRACMSSVAAALDADRLLLLVVHATHDHSFVAAEIVIDGAPVRALVEANEIDLVAALAKACEKALDQSGYVKKGRVIVEVTPKETRVEIAGAEREELVANRFLAAPGRHVLRAWREGFTDRSLEIEVRPGGETRLSIELEPEPTLLASPWFWAGVGGAAIAIGAGAFFLFRPEAVCLTRGECRSP